MAKVQKSARASGARGARNITGDKSADFAFTEQLNVRLEAHLWKTMEKWCEIYQRLEGQAISPQLLSRRWLHLAARFMEDKVERGEIDITKKLPPGQGLP